MSLATPSRFHGKPGDFQKQFAAGWTASPSDSTALPVSILFVIALDQNNKNTKI
jgi:hypothetical protein